MADAGLLLNGILLATILAAYVYCRKAGLDFWRLADLCAPGLLLAYAFGLLGSLFIPVALARDSLPVSISLGVTWQGAIVYESLWNLVLAIFVFRRRQEKVAGALFLRSLIWHGAGLFTAEWLQPAALMWGHFRVRQLMGFIITHLAIIFLWWRKKQSRPPV